MAAEAALRRRAEDGGLGRATALAIGLHLLLAAMFWLFSVVVPCSSPGVRWLLAALDLSRLCQASAAGQPAINADLNVSDADAAAARAALEYVPEPPQPEPEPLVEETPPPQPIPEPLPEESPVEQQVEAQESVPVPDEVQQEEVSRDAIAAETREREQEEKRRQEQIDLTERERQEEVEQRERLARQQEREEKLKQIRAERARLQRQADLTEQRLKQIADRRAQSASEAAAQSDASASRPPGNNGVDPNLLGQYQAALIQAIRSKWTRPDNVPLGQKCRISIRQLPGGEVIDVSVSDSCPYDEAGKRSVEAAVLKAQPLPYAGFESVFSRNLNLNFQAAD